MKIAMIIFVGLVARVVGAAEPDGKKLYANKCSRCHELYSPAEYTEERWNRWMFKMNQKAQLSREEADQLAAYLQSLRANGQKSP